MTIRRFLSTAVATTLAVGSPVFAKEIDLSNRSDPEAEHDIAFCARPSPDATGKPGHAFVAFSRKPHDGQRDFLAIGHTVSDSASVVATTWSYFGAPVSGRLKEELYTSIQQSCLTVTVNREDYEAARRLTASPLEQMGFATPDTPVFQAYSLGEADCMSFMISVANVLVSRGLRVPHRQPTELPMAYIQRFIDAN